MSTSVLQIIGTAVSVLAVTLSLLNLAFQMRQQTKALRSQNYAHALGRLAAVQARLSGDADLADLFARGVRDTSRLTLPERIQFTWAFYEIFGSFEFMYDQARAGALPGEVWKRWEATLAWWLSLPGVKSWWQARPTPFGPRFTGLVEQQLQAPQVDREAAARWQAFVANPHAQAETQAPTTP